MCTLSWQIHDKQLQIVFSRDEQNTRKIFLRPVKTTRDDNTVLSSIDSENDVSSIAVNDHGYVFCLLNECTDKSESRDEDSRVSRGLIIPALTKVTDNWTLREKIQLLQVDQFKPFNLFVFPGIKSPMQWRWDGHTLHEIVSPPQVISSSSFSTSLTKKFRYQKFQKATNDFLKSIPLDRQETIHRYKPPWLIAMTKKGRTTVYITSICADRHTIEMKCQPGDPAATTRQQLKIQNRPARDLQTGQNMHQPGRFEKAPINIDKIFRAKNPALREKIPGVLFSFMKKVIKEKAINNILTHIRNVPPDRFASAILNHINVTGKVQPDFPKLPDHKRRPVFLANHPTGGIDGLLLLSWLSPYYPDIKLLGNDVLGEIPHLRPYIVPVDRFGGSRASVRQLFEVFNSDIPLIIFPSGTTARKHKGKLVEGAWQKMPVRMAIKSDRTLIPLHIQGRNSFLFYKLASVRRVLNLDLNLEMLLLPREFLKPVCKNFSVSVGSGFSKEDLKSIGKTDQERIARLQEICEQLPAKNRSVGK